MKIFLIGFMGCGKSYWGKKLAQRLNIPFFDLDEKIEEQAGKPISEIFASQGEESFRIMEKEVMHLLTESHETFIMACGGGTPCFYNNIDYLKKSGSVLWLNCTSETLLKRLKTERPQRPLISDLDDAQLKAFILRKYSSRKIFYQQADSIISEDQMTLDSLLNTIFHANQ